MFIDEKKSEFGVEPICRELQVAPSSYYAAKFRPPSKRSVSDAVTAARIHAVHKDNFGVYGARKVHACNSAATGTRWPAAPSNA
ncbi:MULTISPECIES: hypothetical protein [Cryobacterium]|uniref:hypothetical protein n=1 Tax=Cryobacterium TaxID=69578 RepID=UPI00141BF176|nr:MULTISPECIES: hypothetical protein [Cryobacterium]